MEEDAEKEEYREVVGREGRMKVKRGQKLVRQKGKRRGQTKRGNEQMNEGEQKEIQSKMEDEKGVCVLSWRAVSYPNRLKQKQSLLPLSL